MTGQVLDHPHIGNRRYVPCHHPPASSHSHHQKARFAGLVATMSIDSTEVAELVVRALADEWVATLIAEHRGEARTAQVRGAVTCGAPRRYAPHAPCRSTGLLANGHVRWHQGPQDK